MDRNKKLFVIFGAVLSAIVIILSVAAVVYIRNFDPNSKANDGENRHVPAVCGNNKCEIGETELNCLQDCSVNICNPAGDTQDCDVLLNTPICDADIRRCVECNDKNPCDAGSTCVNYRCQAGSSEPVPTASCGNNVCEQGEDRNSCAKDCNVCTSDVTRGASCTNKTVGSSCTVGDDTGVCDASGTISSINTYRGACTCTVEEDPKCETNSDCKSGEVCNTTTGQCGPIISTNQNGTCSTTSEASCVGSKPGAICNFEGEGSSGSCVVTSGLAAQSPVCGCQIPESCSEDTNCAAGKYCDKDAGLCEVGCRADSECGDGKTCNAEHKCVTAALPSTASNTPDSDFWTKLALGGLFIMVAGFAMTSDRPFRSLNRFFWINELENEQKERFRKVSKGK